MRLSIRYKILAVTGLLLLTAVGFYTLLASFIFMEQKTALLYDLNHSIAVNTAGKIRASFQQLRDELKLFVLSRLLGSQSELRLADETVLSRPVKAVGVYQKKLAQYLDKTPSSRVSGIHLPLMQLMPALSEAMENGQSFWLDSPTGRYFFAARLDLTVAGQPQSYVTVAELDPQSFFEGLDEAAVFESFLMKPSGEVLIHLKDSERLTATPLPNHPLLEAQRKPASVSGVQSYEYDGVQHYGAYAPVGVGSLFFVSQADQSQVTSALTVLLQRSLLFGLIVATLTFIASVLFSKRLTRNLQFLTEGALSIGAGDLSSHIRIRSGDEVEALAKSFNQMIDALRASREAIEQTNRELEEKVALRTQQLSETNATIRSVQEKLMQTTQLAAVGEVAGRTAHELLNPLTAILSRIERSQQSVAPPQAASLPSQLLEILNAWKEEFAKGGIKGLFQSLEKPSSISPGKTLLEEDFENLSQLAKFWTDQSQLVGGDLGFVREQAQRIHRIVDKMREFVRSSVKSEVPCEAAVKEAVSTMADFLAKNQVHLELNWNVTQDRAELNRDELIQILTNLLRNSYQAIKQGGKPGTVRIEATNQARCLNVDIIDNGIGISPSHQSRLFQQGFTTKGPSEGTGLGLAICRRYAHAFGGEVELLYSEPSGRGTCFRVSIPVKNPEAKA